MEEEVEMEEICSSSDEEWNEEYEEVSLKVVTETKYDQNQWQHHQSQMKQDAVVVSYESQVSSAAAVATANAVYSSVQSGGGGGGDGGGCGGGGGGGTAASITSP